MHQKKLPVSIPLHGQPLKENGNQTTIEQTLNGYRIGITWTLNGSRMEASVLFHSVLHTYVRMYVRILNISASIYLPTHVIDSVIDKYIRM